MGLETEDISRAFQLELQRQQVVTGRERLGLERERIGLARDKASADALRALNKDERTAAMKNYDFYTSLETKAGRTPKPFASWDEDERTTKQKDYEYYTSQGGELSFHEWDLELRRAGATAISLGARASAAEKSKLTSFTFRQNIEKEVDKVLADDRKYRRLKRTNPNEAADMRDKMLADRLEARLRSSGEVANVEAEQKADGEFGWNITFKDGSTTWVRFK